MPAQKNAISAPLWAELRRRRGPATIRELQLATRTRRSSVVQLIGRWERAGFVSRIPETRPLAVVMTPTVAKLGKPPRAGAAGDRKPSQRQRIWTSMRILKRFDVPALSISAEAARRTVETYLNALMRAGYIERVSRGSHKAGTWSVYRLSRDTGRKSPAVTQRAGVCSVFDRNLGRIVASEATDPTGGRGGY
jgi:DNA-binding IclR family transcriptional regulator